MSGKDHLRSDRRSAVAVRRAPPRLAMALATTCADPGGRLNRGENIFRGCHPVLALPE